jgi:4-hydroxy-tetrahydrodipicolinate synthase
MARKISGVIAAVPTPISASRRPDMALFLQHCNWALDNGCDALNILGTTGEANSLDSESREMIMREAIQADIGSKCLMVGTGTASLTETIKFTCLAAELKYDAALILPPFYYKPVSDDGLFNYFSEIVNAVKDKEIGIYLYNFPQLTGIKFSSKLVSKLLNAFPMHMAGMKDSSGDLDYARKMAAEFKGRFNVFPSSEGCLPEAKKDGFAGCISASVNLTAPYAAKVWQGASSLTVEDCTELKQLREDISSVPIVAAVKTLIAIRSGNSSWQKMMAPLVELSEDQIEKMKMVAKKLGYL